MHKRSRRKKTLKQRKRITVPQHREKIREWLKLFPGSQLLHPNMPQWGLNAWAECQKMYFPELWQRFSSFLLFKKDPLQIGLYCGYQLAQVAHARDNRESLAAKHPRIPEASEDERGEYVKDVANTCQSCSLDQLRLFAAGFYRGLKAVPFDLNSGQPTAATMRYNILRLIWDNWREIERGYVRKKKTIEDFCGWLSKHLGPNEADYKRVEKICQTIEIKFSNKS